MTTFLKSMNWTETQTRKAKEDRCGELMHSKAKEDGYRVNNPRPGMESAHQS